MADTNAPFDRDQVEGHYTETDPEAATERTVHGQYTETEGHTGPDDDVVGAYVGTERDGQEPLVRSAHQRIGNYPRTEH
ncbi:hypothetical protein ACFVU2_20035 [Leifsonia sp. NPDC058194]|uniref:hypothetical protein n=1 Tax=Leifsonia sp. NPDC058194 TaxID=3346374 RepID=UPI0036DCB876